MPAVQGEDIVEGLGADDPRRVGAYQLLGRLGQGGMGRVYLARSERGRTVAVKLVQQELAKEPEFRRRFAQEVTAARRVGGEWTAPVLDADTEAATPWVATGYVAGPSLYEVVAADHGPLPEASVLALAAGLTRALQAIHGAGIVHRDLKPSNVLVTIDGPRVIDFGIARALDSVTASSMTRTGAVIGSPGFMSPEQVRGEQVTVASDVFCLGSVLAFAATGRMPFGTDSSGVHALMFRIAEAEPDLSGMSGRLHELVRWCLAKEPAERPSVAQLLEMTQQEADSTAPWLPGELLAQLGRRAVQLLDAESPQTQAVPSIPAPTRPFGQHVPHVPITPPQQFRQPQTPPPVWQHAPVQQRRPQFRPPGSLLTALTALLAVLLTIQFGELILYLQIYGKLGDLPTGYVIGLSDEKSASDLFLGLNFLLFIPTAVLWSVWFHRLRSNAQALSAGPLRYSAGLAGGAWYIPVAQFWIPKQIANDIWRTSSPRGSGQALLNAWWSFWVPSMALMIFYWETWESFTPVEDARRIVFIGIIHNLCVITAAALAIALARTLSALQTRHAQAP